MDSIKEDNKRQLFKGKNIKGFGFFVVASFLFLILLKFSETYTQTLTLKVKIDGLNEEMKIASDTSNTIDVLVKARGFNYLPYFFSEPKPLSLNFEKDLKRINNILIWDVYHNAHKINEAVGDDVEVLLATPDTLYIEYDVLSSKVVPVRVSSELTFNAGYDVYGKLKQNVDSVKLVGLKEDLKRIDSIGTESLILKDISGDFEKSIGVKLPEKIAIEIIPNEIHVTAEVKKFTEGELKVPIILENVPEGMEINFFPKEIELFYYVDLDNYKRISPEDFKVVCDFGAIANSDQQFLIPKIVQMPAYVKRSRLGAKRIEFIILK